MDWDHGDTSSSRFSFFQSSFGKHSVESLGMRISTETGLVLAGF